MLATSRGKAVVFSLLGNSLESNREALQTGSDNLLAPQHLDALIAWFVHPSSQPALSALGPDCPKVLLLGAFDMDRYLAGTPVDVAL